MCQLEEPGRASNRDPYRYYPRVMKSVHARKAVPPDAAGIVRVLEAVVAERIHSAIDRVWTVEQEARYLEFLTPREAFHVAVDTDARIVGFQSLDLWSSLSSMAHVGQTGTFLLPEWRGLGVGRQLWDVTETFAREAGYQKLAIQVRASNRAGARFPPKDRLPGVWTTHPPARC